jgi:hypothetical protein
LHVLTIFIDGPPPTPTNTHVPPILTLPDLRKVKDNEIALAIYEVVLVVNVHNGISKAIRILHE